jgi:hypothetical protein
MISQFPIRLFLLALCLSLNCAVTAMAGDYASEISAYRHAHGLPAVRLDSRLDAVALIQARAMASTGTVSHSAGGDFSTRVAGLRKSTFQKIGRREYRRGISELRRNAEAVGRLDRPPRESVDGRRAPCRRRVRGQSEVALPKILGDGDHGLTQ